ncbi:MAG: methylenetetrahydrofolate reductase C-terminal domain-containing protein [Thermoplasmatota archaeon]
MIISKQKDFQEIIRLIYEQPVFIVGCSQCATLCHTGGEEEVKTIKNQLEDNGIGVSGWIILDPACHRNNSIRLFKNYSKQLSQTKTILVLSCGNGVQTVSNLFEDKTTISGCDTLFLGEITRLHEFNKQCNLCGECLLNLFDGLCPISKCPKSMLNGPCGGSVNGKCEVNSEYDCVWTTIYNKLKKKGKLNKLSSIQKPKDWSKSLEMSRRRSH